MKAIVKVRVKATGEIKEVARGIYSPYQYVDNEGTIYTEGDVEELPGDDGVIFFDPTIDYWTRLEHQYAGMAMQGLLNNSLLAGELKKDPNNGIAEMSNTITKAAVIYAHALVEKLKESKV